VNYYDIVVELGGKQRRKSSCEDGGKREKLRKREGVEEQESEKGRKIEGRGREREQ
jgi:hypothetical protein